MADIKLESIQAIDRAFQVLETISRKNSMSLNDLYLELKISKASLLRIVYTLVQNGYLAKNPTTGNYTLTLKCYEVGTSAIQNMDQISLINSTVVDLSNATGRIAQFSIEDGNQLLCLQSIGQKDAGLSIYTNMGRRSPLYCTSAGKALLATYSNDQILSRWPTFEAKPLTQNTHTDVRAFLQDLNEVRRRNYATDREELEEGLFCVGAVIMGYARTPIGAISISGDTLTPQEENEISELLLSAIKRLSKLLGYV